MTLIPFGKPFPGIDSVSLRDGVAAGLVNGFINELKDYEKVPGHTLFGGYPSEAAPSDPPPDPDPPTRGLARHFNGAADNLSTFDSNSTYTDWTWLCWAKRDSLGTRNALTGRIYAANNGWSVFVDENNMLTFRHDSTQDQVACPDLTDWMALAISHHSIGGGSSGETKFYSGATAATMALISTVASPTGGFSELSVGGIHIGWASGAAQVGLSAWNGSLDHYRLWSKLLTLEEIRLGAVCESVSVHPDFLKLAADITGANPEPCIFNTLAGQFVYPTGTTVVEGIICP